MAYDDVTTRADVEGSQAVNEELCSVKSKICLVQSLIFCWLCFISIFKFEAYNKIGNINEYVNIYDTILIANK